MPDSEDRGIGVVCGAAANDTPGSGTVAGGDAEARIDDDAFAAGTISESHVTVLKVCWM